MRGPSSAAEMELASVEGVGGRTRGGYHRHQSGMDGSEGEPAAVACADVRGWTPMQQRGPRG